MDLEKIIKTKGRSKALHSSKGKWWSFDISLVWKVVAYGPYTRHYGQGGTANTWHTSPCNGQESNQTQWLETTCDETDSSLPFSGADQVSAITTWVKGKDQFLWRHNTDEYKTDEYIDKFSSFHTWNQVRQNRTLVPWGRTICFSQRIPCCGFISWLAMRDRLPTGMRMRTWGH